MSGVKEIVLSYHKSGKIKYFMPVYLTAATSFPDSTPYRSS